MNITWAQVACLIWFVVLLAAFIVAVVLAAKQQRRGVLWGLTGLVGGLLIFAFVSAVIGLYEIPAYYTQPAFYVSLGIGALGTFLFGLGCAALRRNNSPSNTNAVADIHPRSTLGLIACGMQVLAVALLLGLNQFLPVNAAIELAFRFLLASVIAGVVSAIGSVIALWAVVRSARRRQSWHWPIAAVSLSVIIPCVYFIGFISWPTQERLVAAAGAGDERIVARALWLGRDINEPDEYRLGFNPASSPPRPGRTALTSAVLYGRTAMVQYLLAHGANVNQADGEGDTPLKVAGECLNEAVKAGHPAEVIAARRQIVELLSPRVAEREKQ